MMWAIEFSSGAPTSANSEMPASVSVRSLRAVATVHGLTATRSRWQPAGHQRTIHAVATGPLPRGTLTFLFTDIEGSTKLLNGLGTDRYQQVLEAHTEALRRAFAKGYEVRIEGDALFVVFPTAQDALEAGADAQRALAKTVFPHGAVVRVRMGMHTGEGTPASEKAGADY